MNILTSKQIRHPNDVAEELNNQKIIELPKPKTNLESKTESWIIPNVNYNNELATYEISKQLLNQKTQDEHAQYALQNPNDFNLADIALYHAIFTELYNQKNNSNTEEIKQFINKSMKEHWLVSLTRIIYKPNGNDQIIHNYKQPNQTINEINTLIGKDGYINKIANIQLPLNNLLQTNNQSIKQINEIYKWITEKDTYFWRINQTPNQDIESVVRFCADSGGADLGCGGGPSFSDVGLGVRKIFHMK